MRSGGNHGRVIEHMRALAAELTAYAGELPPPANNSAPPTDEPRMLSTRDAARLLGVTPYTLNEWARLGRVRCRQDTPGGRRYFHRADLATYEAEHQGGGLPDTLHESYSCGDDNNPRGLTSAPAQPASNPSRASDRARSNGKHRRPVGARRTRHKPASAARPFAPGNAAWNPTVEKPPES